MKQEDRDEELELLKSQLSDVSRRISELEKTRPPEDPQETDISPTPKPTLANLPPPQRKAFVKPALLQRLSQTPVTNIAKSIPFDAAQPPASPTVPPLPVIPAASFRPASSIDDKSTWEWRIATVWFPRIAIAVLGLVLITLAREYSTGAGGRAIFGYTISLLLFGAGMWREKRYPFWAIPLSAAGLAFSYFTTFAIGFIPAMRLVENETMAYGLLGLNLAAIIAVAQMKGSEAIAIIAVTLGFFTTGADSGDRVGHVSIILLTAMTAILYVINQWRILIFTGVVFTYLAQHYAQRFNGFTLEQIPTGSLTKQVWLIAGYFLAYTLAVAVSKLDKAETDFTKRGPSPATPDQIKSYITWVNNILFFGMLVLTFNWFKASPTTIATVSSAVMLGSLAMAGIYFRRSILAMPWVFLALLDGIYTGVQYLSPHVLMTGLMVVACGMLWAAKRMGEPNLAYVTPMIFFYVLCQMAGFESSALAFNMVNISEWWLLPPLVAGVLYCAWWHRLMERDGEKTLVFSSFLGIALTVATFPQFILFSTPQKYLIVLGGLVAAAGVIGTRAKWPGAVGIISSVAIAAVFPFVQRVYAGDRFPTMEVITLGLIMIAAGALFERRGTGHISLDHTGYRLSYIIGTFLISFALLPATISALPVWLLAVMATTLVIGRALGSPSLQLSGAVAWFAFLYLVIFRHPLLGQDWLVLLAAAGVGLHTLLITGLLPRKVETSNRTSEIKFLGVIGIGTALILAFSIFSKEQAMTGVIASGFAAVGLALLGRWLRAGFIAVYSVVMGGIAILYFQIGAANIPPFLWWQELLAAGFCSILFILAERVLSHGVMIDRESSSWNFGRTDAGQACRYGLMGASVLLMILALLQSSMANLYISMVLMMVAFIWLALGLITRDSVYRQVGFYMMLFCLAKMFLYDISQFKNLEARLAGWGVAAVLLILASFLYSRRK